MQVTSQAVYTTVITSSCSASCDVPKKYLPGNRSYKGEAIDKGIKNF